MKASGDFEVQMKPLDNFAEGSEGRTLGRMSIDKTFKGDLDATSKGEMLSAMTAVKGSAGYVAIEQVHGSLAGKQGSFVLQHYGVMHAGANYLKLEVVPDSGSDELVGISGKMSIEVTKGRHSYVFDYEITQ